MPGQIKESDWKVFSQLRAIALDRFLQSAVADMEELATDRAQSDHDRFFAVLEFAKKRQNEMADLFDAPRRSMALIQLAMIRRHKLVTDQEMARFSPELRDAVNAFVNFGK